jgi:hypothetical protein
MRMPPMPRNLQGGRRFLYTSKIESKVDLCLYDTCSHTYRSYSSYGRDYINMLKVRRINCKVLHLQVV